MNHAQLTDAAGIVSVWFTVGCVTQNNLVQMVGTTCSQVNHLINNFRKLGHIDCSSNNALTVHSGLLSVVLHN